MNIACRKLDEFLENDQKIYLDEFSVSKVVQRIGGYYRWFIRKKGNRIGKVSDF